MDRSDSLRQPDDRDKKHNRTNPPELEGINPLNPDTFPRAEDDEETFAHSPEFHDTPEHVRPQAPGPKPQRRS